MTVQNAFAAAAAYRAAQTAEAPPKESKPPQAKEKYEWRVITKNPAVQIMLVEMIIESFDHSYGPISVYFADRDQEAVVVSFEMVTRLAESESDFIALYKTSPSSRLTVSLEYSHGSLAEYFGEKFASNYSSIPITRRGRK